MPTRQPTVTRTVQAGLLLLGLCLGGCSDAPEGSASAFTVRDSLGTRVVEHTELSTRPAIPLRLVWDHGHAAGDYEFQFIRLGALDADGGAVVGDMGNQEVVAVSPSGAESRVLAPTGQGPTEVMGPRAVEAAGEHSFWIEDTGNARLLLFDGGELVRSVSTQGNATLTRGMMPLDVDRAGRLLMSTASYRSRFEQPWLDGSLTRFDPDTEILDTVGVYPMAPRRPETGRNPFAAFGVVTGAGGGFVHARQDIAELTWRSSDGVITQIVRWQPTLRYPTAEYWDRFEAGLRADLGRVNPTMSGEMLQQFVDDQVASFHVDESVPLPLFGQIHGASSGSVWLAEATPGSDRPTRYQVVSTEGELVGVADFERPFLVLDIRGQLVLGMIIDEYDVQGLAVYRFGPER